MPKSLHGTSSVSEARGYKEFAQFVNGGGDAVLLDATDGSRIGFYLQNLGAAAIYLGPAGVTAATGIEVPAGGDFEDNESFDAWYYNPNGVVTDVRVVVTRTNT